MNVLHFGAGNIGRGFIGKLLADSGAHVTFADINEEIIQALATHHQYSVNIVDKQTVTETVKSVDGINSASTQLPEYIVNADLITTAVGAQVLPHIANSIAKGLMLRCNRNIVVPLNIIACENMVRGTSQLKALVLAVLPETYHHWVTQHIGFVDSAVDRIVPPTTSKNGNILAVTVESFSEWIVDATQFKGTIPEINGMNSVDNLMAFIERKLFTLNTGHAITAYLGYYYGFDTIREAILDAKICAIVKDAMVESGEVLIKRYHFDRQQHTVYIEKIINRFTNPHLHDETARVGRQPMRKLSANDRLIKPLLGCIEYHTNYDNLLIGIAAALNYRNNDDEQAKQMAEMIASNGIEKTFCELSGLSKTSPVINKVIQIYHSMQNKQF